jgi:hypothetical protein
MEGMMGKIIDRVRKREMNVAFRGLNELSEEIARRQQEMNARSLAEMAAAQNVNFKYTVDTDNLNNSYTNHRWWSTSAVGSPQDSEEAKPSAEIISNTTTKTLANVGIWPLIDAMKEKSSRKWWHFWR